MYSDTDALYYILSDTYPGLTGTSDIYKVDISFNNSNLLKSIPNSNNFNFGKGNIYYTKDDSLYKMSVDDGDEIKICDTSGYIHNIFTVGE